MRYHFAMLSEDEVRRVSELRLSDPVPKALVRPAAGRARHLVAVIQGLDRQVHHLGDRMKQAEAYLDGLAEKAVRVAPRAARV